MRITKSSLTYLMRSGYMTLQVPQVTISLGQLPVPGTEEQEIEIPDNWIIETKHVGGLWSRNERQCVGKERGYWHLSPIGWAANRDAIREAWESVPEGRRRIADDQIGGNTWADFEAWVQRWFEKLARTMDVELTKSENRTIALRAAAARFELMRRA